MAILGDGEWHSAREVMTTVARALPPGQAARRGRSTLKNAKHLPPMAELIRHGQRAFVVNAFGSWYRRGEIELDPVPVGQRINWDGVQRLRATPTLLARQPKAVTNLKVDLQALRVWGEARGYPILPFRQYQWVLDAYRRDHPEQFPQAEEAEPGEETPEQRGSRQRTLALYDEVREAIYNGDAGPQAVWRKVYGAMAGASFDHTSTDRELRRAMDHASLRRQEAWGAVVQFILSRPDVTGAEVLAFMAEQDDWVRQPFDEVT